MATEVKPRSNRLLMVLGIVVAVVAFLLIILLGGNKGGGNESAGRTIDVVVAAVDIPAGTQISAPLVKVVKFAPDQVPAGAFNVITCAAKATGCTDVTGQFASVALPKNSALTTSNVVSSTAKLPPI